MDPSAELFSRSSSCPAQTQEVTLPSSEPSCPAHSDHTQSALRFDRSHSWPEGGERRWYTQSRTLCKDQAEEHRADLHRRRHSLGNDACADSAAGPSTSQRQHSRLRPANDAMARRSRRAVASLREDTTLDATWARLNSVLVQQSSSPNQSPSRMPSAEPCSSETSPAGSPPAHCRRSLDLCQSRTRFLNPIAAKHGKSDGGDSPEDLARSLSPASGSPRSVLKSSGQPLREHRPSPRRVHFNEVVQVRKFLASASVQITQVSPLASEVVGARC